jgi:hypothetical protein
VPPTATRNQRSPIASLRRTEFWLNKVGIVLFLFGVAFFFKYAIDNRWITEEARLGAGVLFGSVLLAFGLRFHSTRRHFSQVLMGGAVATYYITGYAAYNIFPDLHIPYEAAFAFMGFATLLAFALSLWGDDVSLSLIGAAGGLLTPFVLNINRVELPFLVGYTCLVLVGTSAIYTFRGWRSLLWTSFAGAATITMFSIFKGTFLGYFYDDVNGWANRFAAQAGVIGILLAFWTVPVLHEVLHHRNPSRYRRPSLSYLPVGAPKNIHLYILTAFIPFYTLALSPFMWAGDMGAASWGWIAVAGAILFTLVGSYVKRANSRLAYLHVLVSIGLLNIGLVLILSGNALLLALAIEAALLHLISHRYHDVGMEVTGTLIFGAVGLWLIARLTPFLAQQPPALINPQALTDLAVMALAVGASFFTGRTELRIAYRGFAHVALLAWLWREIHPFPNGDGYVMLTWAAYGILLHLLARRLRPDSLDTKSATIAAHLAFEGALGLLAFRMATGYSGASPMYNQKAAIDLIVMGMALVTSFLVTSGRAATIYRLAVHASVLAWLWRESTPADFLSGYIMLRWTAYTAVVAFISHRVRDRITLIASAAPFPIIATLFTLHLSFSTPAAIPFLNTNAAIDLFALTLTLAVSFVAQPREAALALRMAFHAGVLALLWHELTPLPFGYHYAMFAWAAYAALLHIAAWQSRDRITSLLAHALSATVGVWLIGRIIYGLLTTNAAAVPILNPQGLTDLGIILTAALTYWILRSDKRSLHMISLAYGIWLHLALLGWTWQELGLFPNGNGYVTITWALYAIALVALSLRLNRNRVLMLCGLSTLFGVAAKLFLVDLRYVDTIWRILLFLGFGGFFLLVSYFFQNVVRRTEDAPATEHQ